MRRSDEPLSDDLADGVVGLLPILGPLVASWTEWSMRALVIVVAVGATAACTGGDSIPVDTQLLSGTFAVPTGFTVGSINPHNPDDRGPYGAVDATVKSPGGVTYDVRFSPTVIPCNYKACPSMWTTLVLGDATPSPAPSRLSPDIGAQAMCGYNSDRPEVGCDAIVGKEYISVRTKNAALSTADAVAVLRTAVAYAVQSGA